MPRRASQWWLGGAIIALLAVVMIGLLATTAPAQDRAVVLQERLRCPTCKSVSIVDSPSETAISMRRIVAEQVADGRSDEQIIRFFQERYGDWILLDPPLRGQMLLLWLLPVLAAGVGVVVLITRTRRSSNGSTELTDADRSRVQAALNDYRSREQDDDEP